MRNLHKYAQDGGSIEDQFDTSGFNELIDVSQDYKFNADTEESIEDTVEEEETPLYEEEDGEFDIEYRNPNDDIFDMLLNDDSFNKPQEQRAVEYSNRYAKEQLAISRIAKSQIERNKMAFNFYKQEGLSDIQAAAIVGNLSQESGIRPLNYGDRDSKGVAQWRTDRYGPMVSWAKQQGLDPNELKTQLKYVKVEAEQRGDLQRIAHMSDVGEATIAFGRKYERPSEQHANWENRTRNALSVLKHGGYAQYGPSFKVPQPEQFKFKPQPSNNESLMKEELTRIIGGQQLTQITPITSEPAYLTPKDPNGDISMSMMKGTGEWQLPDFLKGFNELAQGTTFIANMLKAQRQRRKEQEQMEEDRRQPVYDNYGISGVSNIPSYNI